MAPWVRIPPRPSTLGKKGGWLSGLKRWFAKSKWCSFTPPWVRIPSFPKNFK